MNNESPIEGGRNGQQPKQSVVCINGVANVNAPRELGANIGLGKYIDYFGIEDFNHRVAASTDDQLNAMAMKLPKYLTSQPLNRSYCLPINSRTRWRSLGISKKVSSKVSVGLCSLCDTRNSFRRAQLLQTINAVKTAEENAARAAREAERGRAASV